LEKPLNLSETRILRLKMTTPTENNCTILISTDKASAVVQDDIIKDLEQPVLSVKIRAIKNAITLLLSGEPMPRLLMSVIKGCLKEENKELKKLVKIYWEVACKYDAQGKLLPEMILVCNAIRNDLNHPNEYVRGATLRFLCRLREPELLEPLIPTVKACLDSTGLGRHHYVRKNAALASFYIHKNFGETLLPDGPELIKKFIDSETDLCSRRNAFLFLFNEAEEGAINFLNSNLEKVQDYGDGFALLVLELCRKVCRREPSQKGRFVRLLIGMLQSDSAAVCYEAAWTLVSLSSAPTAIRAAASTYAQLLNSQSDNNVKLIVLERLDVLKKYHSKVLQEVLMDIMRALSSPNIDICKKTLSIAIDLVSPRNIEEVVQVLKREVVRTQEAGMEKGLVYRSMLIQAIHTCATKFPDVADNVVHVLMDFLNGEGAMDVILFVRSIVEQYSTLKSLILDKLSSCLHDMNSSSVLCVALWVIGSYCDTSESLIKAFNEIKEAIGQLPLEVTQCGEIPEKAEISATSTYTTKNVILSDGTYATQTVASAPAVTNSDQNRRSCLRKLLEGGDVFLGCALGANLTKLALRAMDIMGPGTTQAKQIQVFSLKVLCSVAKIVQSCPNSQKGAFVDCAEQVSLCCRLLLDPSTRESLGEVFLDGCRESYAALLSREKAALAMAESAKIKTAVSQPDDLINIRQLRLGGSTGPGDLYDGDDINKATGIDGENDGRKGRIYQLSGFSDPVYTEANVTVHDYDIVLEILVINRTPQTLTNLTVELATMGDLRLVERPQAHTIGPLDQRVIKANIKVSSTETGHIFGTIVYENSSTAEKTYVNLSDIHLDIMDYIRPAVCTEDAFRSMWAEFEWENKVVINTTFTDLNSFLQHIVEKTNTTCLTPVASLQDPIDCSFLAANLYAVSVFGEDALVNVSVEKKANAANSLGGHVRIRSKTQGIALSLGDRITLVQRGVGATPQP